MRTNGPNADWRTCLSRDGYVVFAHDPKTHLWAEAAWARIAPGLDAPERAHHWQCEGTWHVGVDALANGSKGQIGDVPLDGAGIDAAQSLFGPQDLHRAQVSVLRPGYPKPRAGESDGAFRYRLKRDAAHVDGLLPTGPKRRRMLGEPHAWILGLPLTQNDAAASALVVWQGSHRVMGQALSRALADLPPGPWPEVDLTDCYQQARRAVFETCARRELRAGPGAAILLHRHLLHGISPWQSGAAEDKTAQRAVAYFRPQFRENWRFWLH